MIKMSLEIRRLATSLAVLAAILLPALHAAPAHANLFQTWVSQNGNDGNDCSEASPCATIGQALSQTSDGGKVNCLNSGVRAGWIARTEYMITHLPNSR